MKNIIFLLLLLVPVSAAFAQTRTDVVMTVDSVERQFIVVRPSGPAPPGGYPVVFMFHGTGGDGARFYTISGWKEKGQAEGFVTVFPSSLRYCFRAAGGENETSKWNNGEAQQVKCSGVLLKDDIRFVRLMVDTITRMLPVDSRRIYATGFSNGGGFVSKLAVEMSDLFAAIGAAAGPLNRLDSAGPRRHVPIAYMRGDEDNTFIERTGLPAIPFNDSCLAYYGAILRTYLGAFNLAADNSKDSTEGMLTYTYTTPVSAGLPSSEFRLILFKGLAHEYPNGTNYPIAAADILWPFFNRHVLSSTPAEPSHQSSELRLFPNPATDHVFVDGDGPLKLTLNTLLGRRVFSRTSPNGERIDLSTLPRGAYIAVIQGAQQRTVKMMVLR